VAAIHRSVSRPYVSDGVRQPSVLSQVAESVEGEGRVGGRSLAAEWTFGGELEFRRYIVFFAF
jgi:hypothetical protein